MFNRLNDPTLTNKFAHQFGGTVATRRATKTYTEDVEFINDYEETLCKDTITLDSTCYRGELADNVKLDLRFPDKSRIGPIQGQVIFRGPDGVVALRLLDVPESVSQQYDSVKAAVVAQSDGLINDALRTGKVVRIEDHQQMVSELQTEVEALRKQLSILEQKLSQLEDQPTLSKRGFQLPKFKGQEPIVRGTMAQWTGFWVQIQSNQRTGLVVLDVDGVDRFALVQAGKIVAWRSDPVIEEETLGQLLLRSEQIERTQLQDALEKMGQTGQRLGQVLQGMDILTEAQVNGAIHSQLVYVFQKVLAMRTGEFQFYGFQSLPEMYPWKPIQPVSLLMEKLRQASQAMNPQSLLNSLKGVQQQHVKAQPTLTSLQDDIEWNTSEEGWLKEIASGSQSVGQMIANARGENVNLAQLFWALLQLQLIQFVAPKKKHSPIVERLQEKLKAIEGGTHFDVLEVHWISTKSEIEAKYQYLMSELNAQGNPAVPASLQTRIPEILGGVYKAYSSLLDDVSRRKYRADIIEGHHITQAAVLLGQQAIQALEKGDKRTAIQCYAKAMELQPTEVKWSQGLRHATTR